MQSRFRSRSSSLSAFFIFLLNWSLVAADFTQSYCSTQNTNNTNPFNWAWQSNGKCSDNCNSIGTFAFAVLQNQNCWCSNLIPAQQTDMSQCQVDCPGYPSDKCGDQSKGLYIYIQLGGQPSGTQGSSSATVSSAAPPPPSSPSGASSSSSAVTQTTTPLAPASQIVTTIVTPNPETVVQTVTAVVPVITPLLSSSISSSTSPTSTSKPSTTLKTTTSSTAAMTSIFVVTESGVVVTQTLLVAPSEAPARTGSISSGSKTGAIAGGVVGGLLGLGAVIGGVLFFLWRRRRQHKQEEHGDQASASSGITRNASTMSKAGLIGGASEKAMQGPPQIITTFAPQVTRHDLDSLSPVRPSDHRYSQPMMIDSRLDPRAVLTFHGSNISRESLASMDDSRDYGRQLNVRNPDIPNRP